MTFMQHDKFQMILLLIVLIMLQTSSIHSHKCGTDSQEKYQKTYIETSHKNDMQVQQEIWKPIRVHTDWSQIDSKIEKFSLPHVNYLKEKVLPRTLKIFEKLIKTRPIIGNLTFSDNPCGKIKHIPSEYFPNGQGANADFVLFITFDETGSYEEKGIEASGLHCYQDSLTGRPIAGYVTFKPTFDIKDSKSLDYMTWLTLHELTHIFAYNEGLMEDWIDENMKRRGKDKVLLMEFFSEQGRNLTRIVTPNVKMHARTHFSCPSLEGVALENKGGAGTAGSHWSKKFMNTDYMTGDNYGENFISNLTLAVFEDSGWYKPDYSLSNDFVWGKSASCLFHDKNIKCATLFDGKAFTNFKNSYCTAVEKPVCSTSHHFRATCSIKNYASVSKYNNYFESTLGGVSSLMDRCPIPIEQSYDMIYHGGNCRDGYDKNLKPWEKVCSDCACFEGHLEDKNNPEPKKDTKRDVNILLDAAKKFKQESKKLAKSKGLFGNYAKGMGKGMQQLSKAVDGVIEQGNSLVENVSKELIKKKEEAERIFKGNIQVIGQIAHSVFQKHGLTNIAGGFLNDNINGIGSKLGLIFKEKEIKDVKTYCMEFKCENGEVMVKVINQYYKCVGTIEIKQGPITGLIRCPSKKILCDPKYFWKFGGTEKDISDNEDKYIETEGIITENQVKEFESNEE